jgi:hypothetical protein
MIDRYIDAATGEFMGRPGPFSCFTPRVIHKPHMRLCFPPYVIYPIMNQRSGRIVYRGKTYRIVRGVACTIRGCKCDSTVERLRNDFRR